MKILMKPGRKDEGRTERVLTRSGRLILVSYETFDVCRTNRTNQEMWDIHIITCAGMFPIGNDFSSKSKVK